MTGNDNESGRAQPSPFWAAVGEEPSPSAKQFSPSAERNTQPITARLTERLTGQGRALEIASGTGQHSVAFAEALPDIDWTPSDPHPAARASIAARIAESGRSNLQAPLAIDVTNPGWTDAVTPGLTAIVAINLLHISPWEATLGLLSGSRALLDPGGQLFVYGCFMRDARHLSQSNVDFDASLKARDPRWGVRAVEDVAAAAAKEQLALTDVIEMPANNLMIVLASDGADRA